jgi:uncharacterized membrane protein YfcA
MLLMLGLTVGWLSGMLGIGGGFVITPILTFMGIPTPVAIGTGAAQVVATSVSGALAHWRRNNIDSKLGNLLILGGLAGSYLGTIAIRALRETGQIELVVSLAYVLLLGVIGTMMMVENLLSLRPVSAELSGPGGRRRAHHNWIQGLPFKVRFKKSKLYVSALPAIGIGIVVGILTGLMGVGGGFLVVPALIYLLRVPTRIVIGTSAYQILFVTAFATVAQASKNQSIDVFLAIPLMIGGVVGAQVGVRMADKVNPVYLRILLSLLLVAVAVRMAAGLVLVPGETFSTEIVQ